MQLTHYNKKFKTRSFPIILICEQISNSANLGSLFRAADAFGVDKIIISDSSVKVGGKIRRTSRATEKYIEHSLSSDLNQTVSGLKKEDYSIFSLEITDKSHPISVYKFDSKSKLVLIVGNENLGVSKDLLAISDEVIHINMYGQNSSMNVVQATSIALYEITKQIS